MNFRFRPSSLRIYDVLNGGDGDPLSARLFRRFIVVVVLIDLLGVLLRTFRFDDRSFDFVLSAMGVTSAFLFFVEYLCRIWTAPISSSRDGAFRSRLAYMISLLGVIDLLAVMPYLVSRFFPDNELTNLVMEFTKLFLIFKLVRYTRSFTLISSAFSSVRNELMASLSIAGVVVVFSALAMYYVERAAQPEVFDDVGQGFWWAIVTFTTVGYGDVYPVTAMGKILASVVGVVGISMIALPTGILSSAFMTELTKRRRGGLSEFKGGSSYSYCPHCGKKIREGDHEDELDVEK